MIDKVKITGKAVNGLVHLLPKKIGRLVLDLFCRPIDGQTFNKKEQLFLEKSNWVALYLDGKKIQCYTWGTGKQKVLLAHGFNSNASRWRLLVNLLKNDYQVIALDVPAHGNSDWKRVNGLLYAQVIEVVMQYFKPQFIVGHSFAGIAIAYYFSQMDFIPVEKMVLMGIPNELTDVTNVFFEAINANEKVQAAYYKAFQEKFGYTANYFTLSKLLKEVPYPTLIIHDENDDIASFEGAKTIHHSLSNSRFFPTKNLGHSLQSRTVFKEIQHFLTSPKAL